MLHTLSHFLELEESKGPAGEARLLSGGSGDFTKVPRTRRGVHSNRPLCLTHPLEAIRYPRGSEEGTKVGTFS